MKVAIMQPYFFPYIGYWQLISSVDKFVIYDDVTYIKQGYINRNKLIHNANNTYFTLELIGASSNSLINDIRVGRNKHKLLKTIELNYRKAPFFNDVFPIIENILTSELDNLAKFLGASINIICNYLDIKTEVIFSSDINNDKNLKGEEKVIDIVNHLKGDTYINSIGGQGLYDKEHFSSKGIELLFIKSEYNLYQQFGDNFIPNLSIIDVMMFNNKDAFFKYLKNYSLI